MNIIDEFIHNAIKQVAQNNESLISASLNQTPLPPDKILEIIHEIRDTHNPESYSFIVTSKIRRHKKPFFIPMPPVKPLKTTTPPLKFLVKPNSTVIVDTTADPTKYTNVTEHIHIKPQDLIIIDDNGNERSLDTTCCLDK